MYSTAYGPLRAGSQRVEKGADGRCEYCHVFRTFGLGLWVSNPSDIGEFCGEEAPWLSAHTREGDLIRRLSVHEYRLSALLTPQEFGLTGIVQSTGMFNDADCWYIQ